MARSNPLSRIAELVRAGARRIIAGLAAFQAQVNAGRREIGEQKPITQAIAKLRDEFGEGMTPPPTYEELRAIWKQQVRAADAAWRETVRQEAEIDSGVPPTPPRRGRGQERNQEYMLRVRVENPNTGATYWSTVFVTAPEGLTLTELSNLALNAVLTNNRDSKGFRRARPNKNWDATKVEWIG